MEWASISDIEQSQLFLEESLERGVVIESLGLNECSPGANPPILVERCIASILPEFSHRIGSSLLITFRLTSHEECVHGGSRNTGNNRVLDFFGSLGTLNERVHNASLEGRGHIPCAECERVALSTSLNRGSKANNGEG